MFISSLLFSETFYIWSKNHIHYMQERTNAYMTVPKTKVYLYHLYLAFSSAKILTVFQKLSLKIIKQTQMQKTHTIPFVCFTFSFQTLFYLFFFSKPLWQDTFLKHKRNPCTVNNLQLVFFLETPPMSHSHLTQWAGCSTAPSGQQSIWTC